MPLVELGPGSDSGSGSEPGSELDDVDVAVSAYRDAEGWHVDELADSALADTEALLRALRRFPGTEGALGLVSVDADFFLLARVGERAGLVLSDASAATDWSLARSAVDHLGIVVEDDDEPAPAGDLSLLADLGIDAVELGVLLDTSDDEDDLYPDEQLSEIAHGLGFGEEFDGLADLADA